MEKPGRKVNCILQQESEFGVLLKSMDLQNAGTKAWFPKSQIHFDIEFESGMVVAVIPEWLLKQKGWI